MLISECPACRGEGWDEPAGRPCPTCGGRIVEHLPCPECEGTGRVVVGYSAALDERDPRAAAITAQCPACGGAGQQKCGYCADRTAVRRGVIDAGAAACWSCIEAAGV
jgi:DnaJ-class molecular chaperone